jgi:hypothetical protein
MSISKNKLFDSGIKIESLNIVILVRNNGTYLPLLFEMLEKLEKFYDCSFSYFFIENSSTDNTILLVDSFIKSRDGLMIKVGNEIWLDSLPRTIRMAEVRNISKEVVYEKNDWTILLDTDTYFNEYILQNFFENNPTDNNYAMLTAYGVEILKDSENKEFLTNNHYYDTFAFLDLDYNLYWPACNFESCKKCNSNLTHKIMPEGVIEVQSAFGGMAIIKTTFYKNKKIKWEAKQHNNQYLCEHLGFCNSLKTETGGKVGVATNSLIYWDAGTYGLS